MGTRVIEGRDPKVERGSLVVGIDGAGQPYATLGGAVVRYEDGGEVEREGRLDEQLGGHRVRDHLRMDTVGPPGRHAARFVYTGEVLHDDPAIAGAHYLTCWVPFPDTGRAFEVSEDGFESIRAASRRRLARLALIVMLLVSMTAILMMSVV